MPNITTVYHKGDKPKEEPESFQKVPILERRIRVAAYCRVSTLAEEQALSFEAQQKYYTTQFENDPDRILIGIYGDDGISGTSATKRPGFMDLMQDCRHGRIDEIYTKSISRFARNFSECVAYVRELTSLGVVVYFAKENVSSADANVDMILSIMAIIAQEESNSISQNIILAHKYRNRKGDPIKRASYGYRRDRKATNGVHLWHIDAEQAKRVRLVFSLFLEGHSKKEIADLLNAYEKEHGGTKKWTPNVVGNMLVHEAYVGDLITSKIYTVDYLNRITKVNQGEKEQYYLKNHHPAIISREDYARVYRMLGRRLPECMK